MSLLFPVQSVPVIGGTGDAAPVHLGVNCSVNTIQTHVHKIILLFSANQELLESHLGLQEGLIHAAA